MSATKQRPVLVLSDTNYNKMQSDLVVAAITSTAADLDEGLLRATSAVRADKIYTLSNQNVIKKFGHLKSSLFTEVKQQFMHLLDE
ncbi:type II toxin-antitoxin system PemK/MazF family toxin [Cohnella cellulosilytica]|uniref:Type II toxin-antitoxin system PemK/MazF family toxin n=1 Tax=Cohnella cellulosilytica TaxID=986710 RepID=A0ABW2FHS0_9BACL